MPKRVPISGPMIEMLRALAAGWKLYQEEPSRESYRMRNPDGQDSLGRSARAARTVVVLGLLRRNLIDPITLRPTDAGLETLRSLRGSPGGHGGTPEKESKND